jgi:hypothetical protein
MAQRIPNEEGTGRFKLDSKRNKILVIYLGKEKNKGNYHLDVLTNFIKQFLLVDCDYEEQYDAIELNTDTFTLDSLEYDITVNRKKGKSKKRKLSSDNEIGTTIDVFSLFDVLVHKANSPYYTIVGLFDNVLVEDGQEVLGRACGDRVACVALPHCTQLSTLLATVCHELLHTFGVDHNSSHRCVMNAIVVHEDWLFLCLENLQKIKVIHEECKPKTKTSHYNKIKGNDVDFIRNYHLGLLQVLEVVESDQNLDKYCKWLKRVIKKYTVVVVL